MSYLMLALACFGAWGLWRMFRRSRGQLWQWQYDDALILLPLGKDWTRQPLEDNAHLEFKHRRTGATIRVIPGPVMPAEAAIEMAQMMQMLSGIRIDTAGPALAFDGRTGKGYVRRTVFEDTVMAWSVVEAAPLIINMCTMSRRGATEATDDAVRAMKKLMVVRWPPNAAG